MILKKNPVIIGDDLCFQDTVFSKLHTKTTSSTALDGKGESSKAIYYRQEFFEKPFPSIVTLTMKMVVNC